LCLSALLFGPQFLKAQSSLQINWYFGKQKISLANAPSVAIAGDTLVLEQLKCYVSRLECLQDGQIVYAEKNSFHLIDAATNGDFKISLPNNLKYNAIRFLVGIDSLTNVSGAMGGDLDPSLGMYWTWQSGYINCKIEGSSVLCKNPKKTFQFHLGGYAYPFKNYRVLSFNTNGSDNQHIIIQMADWFKACQLQQTDHLMSPSVKAQEMIRIFSDCFKLSTP
jgi:hypothetical protein